MLIGRAFLGIPACFGVHNITLLAIVYTVYHELLSVRISCNKDIGLDSHWINKFCLALGRFPLVLLNVRILWLVLFVKVVTHLLVAVESRHHLEVIVDMLLKLTAVTVAIRIHV